MALRRSRTFQGTAWILVYGQLFLLTSPVQARADEAAPTASAGVVQPLPDRRAPGLAPPAEATVPKRQAPMRPNRQAPGVAKPPLQPRFSSAPTQAEIFAARLFDEPLVPVGATPSAQDNAAMARVLKAYVGAGTVSVAPIEAILEAHAVSPYRASLLLNLGAIYLRHGRPSRALQSFREAWALAKSAKDPTGRAVADKALGEWAQLLARLGKVTELQAVLREAEGRQVGGTAAELLQQGREGAQLMATQPDSSLRCGPLALDRFLGHGHPEYQTPAHLAEYRSGHWGTSLDELNSLAGELGVGLRMAKRVDVSARILLPAIVHWNVGHFAALVDQRGDRLLLKDPVFGGEMWISRASFDDEMSGYALVREANLPPGWRAVESEEARAVWGRGNTSGGNNENQSPCDQTTPNQCRKCPAMARYAVHTMLVSLNMVDTPVGYSPPRGPSVDFTVTYNQRDSFQPQIFSYWNLGPRWTNDWLAYVTDDPTNGSQPAKVYLRGGGQETHTGFDTSTNSYAIHYRWKAQLVRLSQSPILYQRRLADGSIEEYGQPDGALASPRKVLLTRVIDPQGNALTFAYDASLRLVAATDAVGQVTTLSYELPSDPLKVTKVTDPFGRFATFEYNASGQLARITDVVGMQSQFEYGAADFITTLATPYGATTFTTWSSGTDRSIDITDPLGQTERLEYRNYTSGVADSEAVAPSGFSANSYLRYRNTFYWDKTQYAAGRGDYSKATIYHWLHTQSQSQTAGALESMKEPLESRVWYLYAGQARPYDEGTSIKPKSVARVLDDGASQVYQYEYNPIGKPIRETDPLGRTTVYEYADNNIDLLSVKRVNGQDLDLIETRTYNSQHQPLTVTDARGATTTYTYNAAGQVLTVTTPPAEGHSQGPTTAFTYDGNGYLIQISGPVVGATTTVTYDGYGRRRTVTDPAGFTQIFDYDALNRMTKVTYPDGTYEETVYNRLDAEKHRDRRGHWTEAFHDALRRVVATRDAAGGTTQYQYGGAGCAFCGAAGDQLTALIDANGNKATWDYDLQGRMTQETRADASSETYVYETTTSRLKQKTDRKGVTTSFEYFLDGRLKRKSYSDSTPAVSYTYDPVTGQMLTAANGTDTLSWTYDSMDRVATETSAKNASTVGYDYDGAGNRTAVTLNGASYVSHGYDQYSRLTSIARGSSTFSFGYDTASRRASMTYPNGVVTSYTHDAESRLVSLGASLGGAPITGFSYAYDEAGNRTQRTSLDVVESYGYDSLNRLVSADRSASNPSRWRFAYDPVGNRTAAQTDDAVLGAAFNNVNELLSTQAGGALEVRGATSEPANVTVAGKPAQTRADNSFAGTVPIGSGTNSVVVSATDASGNTRTNTYQVNTSGIGAAYTYDGNGNLATRMEGTDAWAYTWNALNQLTKVEKNGSEIARFAYDPEGRRVEKVATGITTTYMYDRLAVLRESRGAAAFTYVHGTGLDEPLARTDGSGLTSYFHADGLGSVAALTTQAGAVAQQYRYDVWGNIEVGVDQPGYAFTGREWDPEIGLYYYRARYYDPRSGRFLSEDLGDDALIYAYVTDNPTTFVDALGMAGACFDITVTSAASCKADVQDAKGAGKDVGAKGCPLGITTRWGGEGICDSLLKKIKKEPLHFAQGCGSGCCKNKRELKGSSTQEETFEFYIFKDKNSDDWQSTQDALPKNIKQACKLKVKIKLQGVFEGWSGTCE